MEKTVSERVRLLRTSLDLTQSDFAQKIGSSMVTVSRLENGASEPRTATLISIAKEFNVNREWLFDGIGELNVSELKNEKNYGTNNTPGANPWRDALIDEMKSEIEFLKQLLLNLSGKASANFNDAFDLASLLDGKSIESVRVAA